MLMLKVQRSIRHLLDVEDQEPILGDGLDGFLIPADVEFPGLLRPCLNHTKDS
jgi:hypothetical protein